MNRPKFSVGEEVIICSPKYPQHTGEAIIEEIIYVGNIRRCRISGIELHHKRRAFPLMYVMTTPYSNRQGTNEIAFLESSLRKKHTPGDQTFEEMMNAFKMPKPVRYNYEP